jgi:hypothetical protein
MNLNKMAVILSGIFHKYLLGDSSSQSLPDLSESSKKKTDRSFTKTGQVDLQFLLFIY